MDQAWFEMAELRRRRFATAVWIPLRASQWTLSEGERGHAGYKTEFFGAGSLAVAIGEKSSAEKLGWDDLGLHRSHVPEIRDDRYKPADVFEDYDGELTGVPLVLVQPGNRLERTRWHLHQDLVIALKLVREGDSWLCFDEGYIEVARLVRSNNQRPALLEVRAEHLKDYLRARNMALYVSSYRSREETVDDIRHIEWPEEGVSEKNAGDRWEGGVMAIHEGGNLPGAFTTVIQISRTDVDLDEDLPEIGPGDDNIVSQSWTVTSDGRELRHVYGRLWRNEWVDPAAYSPRIREDELPPTISFIIDEKGTQENKTTLRHSGRWLWFRPDVIVTLLRYRSGALSWPAREIGMVRCSPDDDVHFGVNKLGLINVFAKDIALLPDWQQKIWAGFNVSPDGGVAEELLKWQAEGKPVDTQAPEAFLPIIVDVLNSVTLAKFGFRLFREHDQLPGLLNSAHRFRAIDTSGLLGLAKDLSRVTADSIDGPALQKIVAPSKDKKNLGSLKSLENVIAAQIGTEQARLLVGPLFGIYDLRVADAHLPSSKTDEAFKLAGVDQNAPLVFQGFQLLHTCVATLYKIRDELDKFTDSKEAPTT